MIYHELCNIFSVSARQSLSIAQQCDARVMIHTLTFSLADVIMGNIQNLPIGG